MVVAIESVIEEVARTKGSEIVKKRKSVAEAGYFSCSEAVMYMLDIELLLIAKDLRFLRRIGVFSASLRLVPLPPREFGSSSFNMQSDVCKFRYSYEGLWKHYSVLHPETLVSFERGWEILGEASREKWLQYGRRRHTRLLSFHSWAHVLHTEITESSTCHLRGFIQHWPEVSVLDIYRLSLANSFPEIEEFRSLAAAFLSKMATGAAEQISTAEFLKILSLIKQDIEENGLDVVPGYFLPRDS